MCGIAGSINWQGHSTLEKMLDAQIHRGPDDHGTWFGTLADQRTIGLGSRRLAIQDLSQAGHMPMRSASGRYTLVYNGELYNYPELRSELEQQGVHFRSNSDTEALLHLYEREGAECLSKLNGMFAFAIWDQDRQELFVARDHFGIKPFYYTQQDNQFAFASEIKSLCLLPGFDRQMDHQALDQYISFLWVPEPRTLFKNVSKIPAGCYGFFRDNKLTLTRYWDLEFPAEGTIAHRPQAELAEELRERFSSAVKSQLISDVSVGAFLSAGLDSSSIVACMARHVSEPINTYTITFPKHYRVGELVIDDPAVAARTAAKFGCKHHEIVVEPDVADLLPKLVWHMDDPTSDPALMVAYLVNREAKNDVTVLLSGIGGDEIFAGYRKYQAQALAKHYRKIPAPLRHHLIEPTLKYAPSLRGTPLKGYMRLAKKLARSGSLEPASQFIMDSIYIDDTLKSQLYTKDTRQQIGEYNSNEQHLHCFEQVRETEFLNQMLYLDSKIFMPGLNLNYNDKMSMASSVEVRVPFLDRELVEWVSSNVPVSMKINGKTTKYILREAMKPWLPAEALEQKKAGFTAPIDYWLANELTDMVDDLLSPQQLAKRGLFEPETVQKLISEQRSGRYDWSMQIWQLLTLELWMQQFIDAA